MRVAVVYENGRIFPHFGKARVFKLYDVENQQVQKTALVNRKGSAESDAAVFLQKHGVTAVICGGIDESLQATLTETGIALYGGVAGDADDAVRALLDGYLHADADSSRRYSEPILDAHPCGDSECPAHPFVDCSTLE